MSDEIGPLISRARELVDSATPGPWLVDTEDARHETSVYTMDPRLAGGTVHVTDDDYPRSGYEPQRDAAFIAWARAGVPQLLDAIAELTSEIEEYRQLCEKLTEILERTADALKGEPPPRMMHSWHDLPQVARRLNEQRRAGL
ncbi:hypothetical protein [Gryllotalpicola protaetiae]|uniref:Uncharacterized protein n=1 Tax=Gryllotalpicola protaetiae TaxID=2419771 RepID=A0A387BEQ1_9MICO|nr:hypothetical protein [Gryllotalpicola protaetiae]AYG02383.1 hypothetical protein D7I44_01760 [Gryllotalpicola protaetiae]